MTENDRKLLADVLRCARTVVDSASDIGCIDDVDVVETDARALQAAIDRYDLRAEDRIA